MREARASSGAAAATEPAEPSGSRQPDGPPEPTELPGPAARRDRRRWRPGLGPLAGLLATTSALLQILTSPALGLADNGDYKRVLNPMGLMAARPPGQSKFAYLVLDFVPRPPAEQGYTATELYFLRAVRWIHDLLGFGPDLDLRVVGAAHAVALGGAVWLVVRALPGPRALRAVSAGLLVVVVTDTRFVVYLNSFYTEPASMLALLFLVAAVLHAWRRPVVTPWGLLAIAAASSALILSKSQDAVLVLPIGVLLLARRGGWGRWSGSWTGRIAPAVVAGLLLVLAAAFLHSQPRHLTESNRYNAVFVEILGHSDDPIGDLRDLGLDPALARYAGRAIYLPGNALKDPHFAGFFDQVTNRRLADFYLSHPGRGLALAHRGATASMDLIPRGISPHIGTQTKADSARPVYDSCKLCLYSSVSRGLREASAVLVPALWAAALALAWLLRRRPIDERNTSAGLRAVLVLLTASAGVAMATALLGEGEFEIVKHLYLASVANGLLAVLVVHAAGLLWWQRRAAEPSPDQAAGPVRHRTASAAHS